MNKPIIRKELQNQHREYCLVEIAAAGFVGVFGPKNLSVKVINRLVARSAKAGNVVDQLIDSALPGGFHDIYCSSSCRANGLFLRIDAKRVNETLHRLNLCQIAGSGLQPVARNLLSILEA